MKKKNRQKREGSSQSRFGVEQWKGCMMHIVRMFWIGIEARVEHDYIP